MAKVLENKGLRPFFYAHLSLSCRLNLQADSENSSKIFEILRKKRNCPEGQLRRKSILRECWMAKWFDTLFIGHNENTIHDLILYYNFVWFIVGLCGKLKS